MSHDAEVLNRLVARLISASQGYRRAGADGPGLSDALAAAADAHARTAEDLSALARAAGAPPAADADLQADARHAWAELPRAVAGGASAVAEAVDRSEAELAETFRAALADAAVSDAVRSAVARGLDGLQAARRRTLERLRDLGG